LFPWLKQKEIGGHGLLRLKGGGKFDENHAVADVIQRNSRKSANLPPSAFETLVASTLFQAQVKRDELRMLKYLHIVSARSVPFLPIVGASSRDWMERSFNNLCCSNLDSGR
jgi:hypothetical protein